MITDDIEGLFDAFAAGLRAGYGKLPVSGFPRITRPRRRKNNDNRTGFSLVDPSGNWIRVTAERSPFESSSEASVSGLRAVVDNAVVIADSHGDAAQAAKILAGLWVWGGAGGRGGGGRGEGGGEGGGGGGGAGGGGRGEVSGGGGGGGGGGLGRHQRGRGRGAGSRGGAAGGGRRGWEGRRARREGKERTGGGASGKRGRGRGGAEACERGRRGEERVGGGKGERRREDGGGEGFGPTQRVVRGAGREGRGECRGSDEMVDTGREVAWRFGVFFFG